MYEAKITYEDDAHEVECDVCDTMIRTYASAKFVTLESAEAWVSEQGAHFDIHMDGEWMGDIYFD